MKHSFCSVVSVAVLWCTLLLAGCDLFSDADSSPVIVETDQQSYTLGERISFTASNRTESRTLYLNFCGPDLIYQTQQLEDRSWEGYSGTLCKAIYAIEYEAVAEAGERYRWDSAIRDEGSYRVKLYFKLDSTAEESEIVYSNAFTVR